MTETGAHIFETAFGFAGIAWRGPAIAGVVFPEKTRGDVSEGLQGRVKGVCETPPPRAIARLCHDIAELFAGARPDFSDVEIDDASAPAFDRNVWRLTREIPAGEMRSYGDLAKDLGDVACSQRVGQALGRNPFPIIVPCHRVVGADGKMTGFSAAGGVNAKRKLLKLEGALPPELFD